MPGTDADWRNITKQDNGEMKPIRRPVSATVTPEVRQLEF